MTSVAACVNTVVMNFTSADKAVEWWVFGGRGITLSASDVLPELSFVCLVLCKQVASFGQTLPLNLPGIFWPFSSPYGVRVKFCCQLF